MRKGCHLLNYTSDLESEIKAWSESQQSNKRFAHTHRVVTTVTKLAEKWRPEAVMRCRLAGWIHDAAKQYDDDTLLDLARHHNLPISPFEESVPMMLHGIVAYALAAEKFGIDDTEIKIACAYHTSGSPQLTLLGKLLFLADKIEPERNFSDVDEIRALALKDINAAILLFLKGNFGYLMSRNKRIDPLMLEFYNELVAP